MKHTKMLQTGIIMFILLVMSACGATSNESTGTMDHNQEVKNESNEVEKQQNPEKRIIGTSVTYPEFLYALGVIPVAAENYHEEFPAYLHPAFQDVMKLGSVDGASFEAMLEAEPDLILAPTWRDEKSYDQLSKIAPTVLLPDHDDWRDELREMGQALGKFEKAEQVIQEYERKTDEAKQKLHAIVGDETVLYMRVMSKAVYVLGEQSSRGSIIHRELGLKPVSAYPADEGSVSISLEMLPEYNLIILLSKWMTGRMVHKLEKCMRI